MKWLAFFIFIIPTIIFAHIKPLIGVSVKELPDSLIAQYDRGILIDSVTKDSPGFRAGIKKGDIIISIDKSPIVSILELKKIIEKYSPYQNINIGIIHKGKKHFVNLKLDKIDEKIYLGIMLSKDKNRLLINDIIKKSPAEKGGLLIGDEIISIDDEKVENPKDVSQILDKKGYNKDILIKIIRKNNVMKKRIFLFYWDATLFKQTTNKKDIEFIKDMKRIFLILDEK